MDLISNAQWRARCEADGEFLLAARHWTGSFKIHAGSEIRRLTLTDGQLVDATTTDLSTELTYTGSSDVWTRLLMSVPERFYSDPMFNMSLNKGLKRSGDPIAHAQFYPAIARAIELLRPPTPDLKPPSSESEGIESVTGHYANINVEGVRHRIYFERAGQGIPVLLQHTAGCHASQWRHLMNDRRITDRFELIAYDLPFHGKSIPPVEEDWWARDYQLREGLLRALPRALANLLGLQQPVFMGCSVGGLLALDLAHKHPEDFRAVISIEGALHIGGSAESLSLLWHPQIGNQYKARLMEGLIAPQSPKAYRKETSWVYASGWPPSFIGDLNYYTQEYDLRQSAADIDTAQIDVHILSGEYDYSGLPELGRAAHEAIAGSTFTLMGGVGHFPMSENPAAFIEYLLPVLEHIENRG